MKHRSFAEAARTYDCIGSACFEREVQILKQELLSIHFIFFVPERDIFELYISTLVVKVSCCG